jgi:fatty acid desaturase
MQPAPLSPKPAGVISAGEMLFFFVLFLFLVIVCVWPILTWRIHHFSTWAPDSVHSYPVRDHSGGTVYLHPTLGKFYVSLPWLWGALLTGTVLTGLLGTRQPGGKK